MMAMFRRPNTLLPPLLRRIGHRFGQRDTNIAQAAPALPRLRPEWWISGLAILLVIFLVQSTAIPALAEYHMHRGDVIDFSVSGSPELHRRIMIDNEGKIYLPMLGELTVAGLSLPQLRQQLHDLLVRKHAFENPDVTVDIAEYRPVYVTGDVSKPGAYSYRPGMTVRDAVALAGGYRRDDALQPRGGGELLEAINARDQYDSLLIDFVKSELHVARLQAELAGGTEIDLKNLRTNGVAPRLLAELASMEAQQLKTDQDDYDKEKTHLQRLIKETQDQISALVAEQAQQQLALARQQKDAARVQGLFRQSLVQIARLEEEQRAVANTEMQFFEVKARIAQAYKDLEDYTRRLQKLADQRKIEVTQQLETATGALATLKIHLATAGEKVRYMRAEKPQVFQDGNEVRNLVIFRNESADQQRIAADEDTDLLPGDAVEITQGAASGPQGLASGSDLSRLAAIVSGKGLGDDPPEATARAALPPAPPALRHKTDAVSPLPADPPRLPARSGRGAPARALGGNPAPATPAQPKKAVPRHERTASTMPPAISEQSARVVHQTPGGIPASAAPPRSKVSAPRNTSAALSLPQATAAGTAPLAVASRAGSRSAADRLREAGDVRIIEGDLVSARLFYERAADAGDARAALALGNSFNPAFLERLGVLGIRGNAAEAIRWYHRARALGNPGAELALRTLRR